MQRKLSTIGFTQDEGVDDLSAILADGDELNFIPTVQDISAVEEEIIPLELAPVADEIVELDADLLEALAQEDSGLPPTDLTVTNAQPPIAYTLDPTNLQNASALPVEIYAYHEKRAAAIPYEFFNRIQALSADDFAQSGIDKVGLLPNNTYGILINDLNKYVAFRQSCYQSDPINLPEVANLPNAKQAKKKEATYAANKKDITFNLFNPEKRKREKRNRVRKYVKTSNLNTKDNAKFTIDEQQKIFISIYDVISHSNYKYSSLSPTQLAWLQAKKVTYLDKEYQMTDSELDLLIDMLIAYKHSNLFEELWHTNSNLPNYVFQMEGKKIYAVFCQLMKAPLQKPICMEIWLKAEKFLPWLKLDNCKKLIELFIKNAKHSYPFVSVLLLENFSEIKDWYDQCENLEILNMLLTRLMRYSENSVKTFIGKNTPLTRLFISRPNDKKLELLLDYVTHSQATANKFSLIFDITPIDILKTLLERLHHNDVDSHTLAISEIKDAIIRAQRPSYEFLPATEESNIPHKDLNTSNTVMKTSSKEDFTPGVLLAKTNKRKSPDSERLIETAIGENSFLAHSSFFAPKRNEISFTLANSRLDFITKLFNKISLPSFSRTMLMPNEMAWLFGENIKWGEYEYQSPMNSNEIVHVLEVLLKHLRIQLLVDIWLKNSLFHHNVIELPVEKLYDLFCLLADKQQTFRLLDEIFEKRQNDFVTWLNHPDNKEKLVHLFLISIPHQNLISKLWNNIPKLMQVYLNSSKAEDIDSLLHNIKYLRTDIVKKLLGPETPAEKMMREMPEDDAVRLLFRYVTLKLTFTKFALLLNAITHPSILKSLLDNMLATETSKLDLFNATQIAYKQLLNINLVPSLRMR